MMAEGGKIDYSGHGNDAATNIHEVMDLDQAIQVAYQFYLQHPDETLIVVTADHETGGTGVYYNGHKPGNEGPVKLNFSTSGHTGTVVPVFAFGAGAQEFGCLMKNTDIPKKIEALIK